MGIFDPKIKEAEDLQDKAYNLESDLRIRLYDKNDKLSDAYLKAGKAYGELGSFDRAILHYRDAAKRAETKDRRNGIEIKIGKLEAEKSKLKWDLRHGGAKTNLLIGVGCFIVALFFSSFKLTGAVTGKFLSQSNSTFVGTGFFILGLIFIFISFKKKK